MAVKVDDTTGRILTCMRGSIIRTGQTLFDDEQAKHLQNILTRWHGEMTSDEISAMRYCIDRLRANVRVLRDRKETYPRHACENAI